jgi:hypothetical protein
MALVRCPECDAELEVADADRGARVECGACGASFAARHRPRDGDDDFDDRPRRRRYRPSPEQLVEDARQAVLLPARFSIAACVLTALYHMVDMAFVLANPQILKNPLFGGGGGFQWTPELYAAVRVVSITWQLVVMAGAGQMMLVRSHGFALMAMVLQVVPCGAGVCCVLTMPFGIWGLVALNRPEVKDGFEAAARLRERAARSPRDREHLGYDGDDDR